MKFENYESGNIDKPSIINVDTEGRNVERNNTEQRENLEQLTTKVILEFIRHGKKEKDKTKPDKNVRLMPEGRMMAQKKGRKLKPQKEVSLGWGSGRDRTAESSLHVMYPEIDRDYSLEEMQAMIDQELNPGKKADSRFKLKKLIEDPRLDLGTENDELLEAFNKGEYLKYLANDSDNLAIERGDQTASSYSRFSGNVAEIIQRYSQIGNNFNRIIVNDSTKGDKSKNLASKYAGFGNQLERYLCGHQGVLEMFIAKVLEKKLGIKKRDDFINSLNDGFELTEGFHVEIINQGEEQRILIDFKAGDQEEKIEIDGDLLEEVIKDKKDFEEKVLENIPQD